MASQAADFVIADGAELPAPSEEVAVDEFNGRLRAKGFERAYNRK